MRELDQIGNQFNSKDVFEAFKTQLAKDFEHSNFPSGFVADLPSHFDGVRTELSRQLEQAKGRSDATIMTLLNRVDISETQWRQYLLEHPTKDQQMAIAELIIKRVLQKVVIKLYYKKNENRE